MHFGNHLSEDDHVRSDIKRLDDGAIKGDQCVRAARGACYQGLPTVSPKALCHRYRADAGEDLRCFCLIGCQPIYGEHAIVLDDACCLALAIYAEKHRGRLVANGTDGGTCKSCKSGGTVCSHYSYCSGGFRKSISEIKRCNSFRTFFGPIDLLEGVHVRLCLWHRDHITRWCAE